MQALGAADRQLRADLAVIFQVLVVTSATPEGYKSNSYIDLWEELLTHTLQPSVVPIDPSA